MAEHAPQLGWIDQQHERMCRLVANWAEVNSFSSNLQGLERMRLELMSAFAALGGEMRAIDLPARQIVDARGEVMEEPIGQAISISKRPGSLRSVLLAIHMDTVYSPEHTFQDCNLVDKNTLRGPGVLDAKGGLAVMLIALEALERSAFAETIGWEVLINPDEEIGSPGSAQLFTAAAKRHQLGMLYEPALPDGNLVGWRKGSGTFTLIIHGKSAHAGRDFHAGRNAVAALADFVVALNAINGKEQGLTLNVGKMEGGGPVNVVPDLAIVRFNLRVEDANQQRIAQAHIQKCVAQIASREGFLIDVHGEFTAPPKPLDPSTLSVLNALKESGSELGLSLQWRGSGGVCDGNRLAAAGLTTVDSLGPRGDNIHSTNEFVSLDSLVERAKLSLLLLMKFATGQLPIKSKDGTVS